MVRKAETRASVIQDAGRPQSPTASNEDGVFRLHEKFSKSLLDAHASGGEDMPKIFDLLACNLPCTIHCQKDFENSEHDVSNAKDMEAFCNSEECLLKRRGYRRIFRFALQFASWQRRFCARTEEV